MNHRVALYVDGFNFYYGVYRGSPLAAPHKPNGSIWSSSVGRFAGSLPYLGRSSEPITAPHPHCPD